MPLLSLFAKHFTRTVLTVEGTRSEPVRLRPGPGKARPNASWMERFNEKIVYFSLILALKLCASTWNEMWIIIRANTHCSLQIYMYKYYLPYTHAISYANYRAYICIRVLLCTVAIKNMYYIYIHFMKTFLFHFGRFCEYTCSRYMNACTIYVVANVHIIIILHKYMILIEKQAKVKMDRWMHQRKREKGKRVKRWRGRGW